MRNDKYMCPVCGYPEIEEIPYLDENTPSYEICPSCGTEYGYDDLVKTHTQLRDEWIINGLSWWAKSESPPSDWNPIKQLKAAGLWSPLLPQDQE